MPGNNVEQWIWYLTIAGHAALAIRLWRVHLNRVYRFFFYYLLFSVGRGLLLKFGPLVYQAMAERPNVPFETNAYGYMWVGTEPVLWVLYFLLVLELHSLVLQKYRGIASLSRWVLLSGVAFALSVATLTVSADLSNPGNEQFPLLLYASAIRRNVLTSLAIFLLFITAFLAWFPVPLSRNIGVHSVLLAVYSLASAVVVLIRNIVGPQVVQVTNIANSSIMLGCIAVWIALLSPKGESVVAVLRRPWMPGEEEHLVRQLAAINSSLLRAARNK